MRARLSPASSLPLPLHSAGTEETESTVGSQPPRHPQHYCTLCTASYITLYRNKITYIVRSVWTTYKLKLQSWKESPSPVAFYYCPICMLYVQLPASWIQCNEHWTVWMIFQSYHHMTESLKTCSYKKVWVNFCIEIGLKKCQLHFLRIALHKVITRELE